MTLGKLKAISIILTVAVALVAGYWQFVSTSAEEFIITVNNKSVNTDKMAEGAEPSSIYEFTYIDIDGNEQSMEKYRGHVLIVVNVASKCGFTCVNYRQLTELDAKYGESQGLRILAFPCNQFNNQEPLSEKEIKEFCAEYNVKYDMSSKINVNGEKTHPLWKFMKEKQTGILGTTLVKWNFTKFLVDKQGNVVKRYAPNTPPQAMEKDILSYLNA